MKNYELRITNYELFLNRFLFAFVMMLGGLAVSVGAQSTNQSYPTAVTTNEISGTIKARDIGDARATAYFYTFNGTQGDVFINVVTSNFNGDIDVFALEGLRPLTKIVAYADAPSNETGRVIYLRKAEKLLLRIEGRTPNDDAAAFRIKFAGSFQAAAPNANQLEEPTMPTVSSNENSDTIVNSVGTIISVKPKPTPAPKETARRTDDKDAEESEDERTTAKTPAPETTPRKIEKPNKHTEVVVTENTAPKKPKKELIVENAEKPAAKENAKKENAKSAKKEIAANRREKPAAEKPKSAKTNEKTESDSKAPNPLESVRLIVVFKDGTKIERPMSEISRVNVDNKGMLTVVSKDGQIGRYSILEVAKMTIE